MPRLAWTALAALVVALSPPRAAAEPPATASPSSPAPPLAWDRTEAMVPMRDGTRLRTVAWVPRGFPERLPVLFLRTPYGFDEDERGLSRWLGRPWLKPLLDDGYVVVIQSVRGRFGSEGTYVMEAVPRDRSDPRSVDEGTDAYDTVEWILRALPTSGRVGMLGASIPGRLVALAMMEHHPAVRAYSPQAAPADNFLGDDDFHGGAFRLLPMFDFVPEMESGPEFQAFLFDRLDLYDWFLDLGPLGNADARHFHGRFPMWNDFVAHPTYDAWWRRRALPEVMRRVPAPTLHVGGAFDQEDRRGPVALYRALERDDPRGWNSLVVGPWAHRTWRLHEGDRLGAIEFGSATARFFREEVQAPFFACHLKDRCGEPLPEALVFQTGSNTWQRLPAWPPRGGASRSVYLAPGGRLAFAPPGEEGKGAADRLTSDPARPVPFMARPVPAPNLDPEARAATWPTWMVADQRFSQGRPDVLAWETPPLAEDVVLSGEVAAHLFVSTTGTDTDVVVKLVDVYPEVVEGRPGMGGYQLMVAGEILRARFRKGFGRAVPFTPGRVEEVTVDLLPGNHLFRKGHRIMVQVQASWFPLYDRNPQTFVESIFRARAEDFRPAVLTVHRSRRHPSRVTFQSPDRGSVP